MTVWNNTDYLYLFTTLFHWSQGITNHNNTLFIFNLKEITWPSWIIDTLIRITCQTNNQWNDNIPAYIMDFVNEGLIPHRIECLGLGAGTV